MRRRAIEIYTAKNRLQINNAHRGIFTALTNMRGLIIHIKLEICCLAARWKINVHALGSENNLSQ